MLKHKSCREMSNRYKNTAVECSTRVVSNRRRSTLLNVLNRRRSTLLNVLNRRRSTHVSQLRIDKQAELTECLMPAVKQQIEAAE